MRRGTDWAKEKFAGSRVARLATVSSDGRPHLVPIVFAVVADGLVTAVDGKPKTSMRLKRLENIAANSGVSVLVDEYAEDWTQLWWARADGIARMTDAATASAAVAALSRRYAQYRSMPPPGPVIVIDVQRWSGWSAAPS